MHSFLDAKAMARLLRTALAERRIDVSHSDCLELVARQFGLANWNTLSACIAAAQSHDTLVLPQDWRVTRQTNQASYRLGLDPASANTALIESRFERGSGIDLGGDNFAAFIQSVVAEPFRGQRVRLTAHLRTENADCGTIWMRVDSAPGNVLQFDNMMERAAEGSLHGTCGWIARQIVLDVPENAASIHYGFLLQGHGRVWARAFALGEAGHDIGPTNPGGGHLPRPANLDFSRASQRSA